MFANPKVHVPRLAVLMAAALTLAACQDAAYIKTEEDPDLVDAKKGGIVVYDQLVSEVTTKLLANHAPSATLERAQGKMKVAFVGIENSGAEELRDIREAIYENIDTILVNEQLYMPVSRRFVDAAMRQTGQRPEDLFLRSGRESFLAAITKEGVAPDYLLFAKVTTLSSEGVDENQRNYQLTLDLVDANTGVTEAKETGRVRKGFNK